MIQSSEHAGFPVWWCMQSSTKTHATLFHPLSSHRLLSIYIKWQGSKWVSISNNSNLICVSFLPRQGFHIHIFSFHSDTICIFFPHYFLSSSNVFFRPLHTNIRRNRFFEILLEQIIYEVDTWQPGTYSYNYPGLILVHWLWPSLYISHRVSFLLL